MSQNGLQANGHASPKEVTSPYMSNEPNSNVANFKIIESTLRGNYNLPCPNSTYTYIPYLHRGLAIC